MVLDHVTDRAGAIVEADPAFEADGFGDGDLDMLDPALAPQRFEQAVGEAERKQVLHRLLAEIMIDPEGPVLGEDPCHRVVDLTA